MRSKLVVACMSLAIVLSAGQRLAAQTTNPPSLAGSWQLTLTPVTPTALMPIHGLATFTSDGSVVETDATEVVPTIGSAGTPVYGTPGHGIWQPAPAVGYLYIQFISLLVNQDGKLQGRRIVTISGALHSKGNRFRGDYGYQLVDPAGREIAMGSGTVIGQRIPHPLLP